MRVWRACVVLAAGLAGGVLGCGQEDTRPTRPAIITDAGPEHVHGLGINPKDGALFIATHTGLFRAGPREVRARRVADRFQDTMGFTVVGPDRFLGSGHPDGRERLPPFLGLIESRDAGRTWRAISLQGRADFHVLEAAGRTVYGFGSDFQTRTERLLVSEDGGRRWDERSAPGSLIALAIDPDDRGRLVASTDRSLIASGDGGRQWRRLRSAAGLLAWPARGRLFHVDASGRLRASDDGGERWTAIGTVGGKPAALEAQTARELYVALHDGTVKRSRDGGRSWSIRSRP